MSGDREKMSHSTSGAWIVGGDRSDIAIAIPLVAVLIPFVAVAGAVGLGGVVLAGIGVVVVILVLGSVAKAVMKLRHEQGLETLRLQIELSRQETAKLAEVDRVIDENVGFRGFGEDLSGPTLA